jgi:hypothetical protein
VRSTMGGSRRSRFRYGDRMGLMTRRAARLGLLIRRRRSPARAPALRMVVGRQGRRHLLGRNPLVGRPCSQPARRSRRRLFDAICSGFVRSVSSIRRAIIRGPRPTEAQVRLNYRMCRLRAVQLKLSRNFALHGRSVFSLR